MKRPVRITLIAWFGIVFGILMLLASLAGIIFLLNDNELYRALLEENTLPAWLQISKGIVVGAVFLLTGVYMLKGRHWAWIGVLVLLAIQFVFYVTSSRYFSLTISPIAVIHMVFYAIYFYLLLSRPSRHYFIGMRQERSIRAS